MTSVILKLSVSLDGYIAAADGGSDWEASPPRRDGLQWPQRDGLKWPHLASVVCRCDLA